jgi:hypothetical protein
VSDSRHGCLPCACCWRGRVHLGPSYRHPGARWALQADGIYIPPESQRSKQRLLPLCSQTPRLPGYRGGVQGSRVRGSSAPPLFTQDGLQVPRLVVPPLQAPPACSLTMRGDELVVIEKQAFWHSPSARCRHRMALHRAFLRVSARHSVVAWPRESARGAKMGTLERLADIRQLIALLAPAPKVEERPA